MPSKKRKKVEKKKIQSKRKAVTREKKITKSVTVKINRSDSLYKRIAEKYDKRHLARSRAEAIGIKNPRKVEGNDPKIAQRNLIDAIYLKTKEEIKVTEFDEIEGVTVENVAEGSRITVRDEKFGDLVTVIDINPSHVKDVKVESKGSIIGIESKSLAGEKLVTSVEINPQTREFIEKEKKKIVGKKEVFPNKYSQLYEKRLLPTLPGLIKSSQTVKVKQEQKKLFDEYKRKNWIPFYYPHNNKHLIDPKMFAGVKEVDYLVEKDSLLKDVKHLVTSKELEEKLVSARKAGKEPKGKKKKPKILKQIRMESNVYVTQTGQHIQTQAFETDEKIGFDWVGLYYQKASKATKHNPIPSIVKVRKQIRADNDDAGHFIAYINNLYAYGNPLEKNFKVVGESVKSADSFRAMRFLAKSIVNTLGVKRNKGIEKAITQDMGDKSLKFRKTKGGMDNLTISEQIIEIVKKAQNREIIATVQTPDRKPINFKVDFKQWNEKKPSLKFIETDKTYHPLDSDTLLRVIVRKFNIDSISGQRLLETLHNQEWITYPRIDVQKAEDEPIKIMNDTKRRALEAIIKGKSFEERKEQLTVQEYEILKIIYDSEKFSDKKENFVKRGYWELKSGDLTLKTNDVVLASEKQSYTPKLFDIDIHKRTVNEEEMLEFLIKEKIGTPATRTAQLERLRGSGVLAVKEGHYVIDRRGYYMVAGHKVFEDENVNLVKDLLVMINNVQDNDFEGLNQLINSFQFIDRNTLARKTKKHAKVLIEAEHDLTYLESF